MAKGVVFNQVDPCIGINLSDEGEATGVTGTCTECGKPMHWWTWERAFRLGQVHVDAHAPVLIGGDTDSLVRG
jgi:hypothetical protein